MRKITNCTCILFFLLQFGCNKDKEPALQHETATTAINNITKALSSIDSLSTFATLLKDATLTDADVAAGFTVLVPINSAFSDQSVAWSSNNNPAALTAARTISRAAIAGSAALKDGSVINDYIIKGKIGPYSLVNGAVLYALSGRAYTVSVSNSEVFVNGVRLSSQTVHQASDYVVYSLPAFINYSTQLAFDINALNEIQACKPGGVLEIKGQNFSSDLEKNIVRIGGKLALVNEAFSNKLFVTVPADAVSGAITITVGGKTITSPMEIPVLKAVVSTLTTINSLNCGPIQGIAQKGTTLYLTDTYNNRIISCGGISGGPIVIYQPLKLPTWDTNGDGVINEHDRLAIMDHPWGIAIGSDDKIYVTGGEYINGYTWAHRVPCIFRLTAGVTTQAEHWAGAANGPLSGPLQQVRMAPLAILGVGSSIFYSNHYTGNESGINNIFGNLANSWITSGQFYDTDPTYNKSPEIYGIAHDALNGMLYLADAAGGRIWKRNDKGQLSVLAGNNNKVQKDGVGVNAQFGAPFGIAVDEEGNLLVCDNDYALNNFTIRLVNRYGVVTTVAGRSGNKTVDGVGTQASFAGVNALVMDYDRNFYIGSDDGTVRVLKFKN